MTAFACKYPDCDHIDPGGFGWCRMHYTRWRTHGDPSITKAGHRFVGDAVTYSGAHIRVRKQRGSASKHGCIACGSQAAHWSYTHTDPNEKHDERGRPYSPDPSHYAPMCASCHKKADVEIKPPALTRDERGCYRKATTS